LNSPGCGRSGETASGHEKRKGQKDGNTQTGILSALDGLEEAEYNAEENHHADERAAGEEGNPIWTPIQAPGTVGIMEIARSQ